MASAAVGETSNAAGNRRSCNQICSNGTSAVNKKSGLLQAEHKLQLVQPGGAGSEKLNAAGCKSCSVNVSNKNSFVDRGNVRAMNYYFYRPKKRKLNKTYAHLIHDTIVELKARKGSSFNAIKKNIERLYGSSLGPNYKKVVGYTLKKLTKDGKLIRTGHSFKLTPEFRGEFDMNPSRQQASQLQLQRKCIKKKLRDTKGSWRVGASPISRRGTPNKRLKPMCRRRSTTSSRRRSDSFNSRRQKDAWSPLAAANRRRPRVASFSRSTMRSRLGNIKKIKANQNCKRKMSTSPYPSSVSTGSGGSKSAASAISAQSGISSKSGRSGSSGSGSGGSRS